MMAQGFTGRHMGMAMVGFFGVVIAVNFTMAWFASNSFGGTVVDNSYVASQKFNGWLADARAQKALGWQATLGLDGARRPVLAIAVPAAQTAPAPPFTATGTAHHPLGRAPDRALVFAPGADGRLVAAAALPPGRWLLRVTVRRGDAVMRLAGTVQ